MNAQPYTQMNKSSLVVLNSMGLEIASDDRRIDKKELVKMLGVSHPTIWRMIKNFQFPASHEFTPSTVRWWLSEVEHWLKLGSAGWYERYGKAQQAADLTAKRANS